MGIGEIRVGRRYVSCSTLGMPDWDILPAYGEHNEPPSPWIGTQAPSPLTLGVYSLLLTPADGFNSRLRRASRCLSSSSNVGPLTGSS